MAILVEVGLRVVPPASVEVRIMYVAGIIAVGAPVRLQDGRPAGQMGRKPDALVPRPGGSGGARGALSAAPDVSDGASITGVLR